MPHPSTTGWNCVLNPSWLHSLSVQALRDTGALRDVIVEKDRTMGGLRRQLEAAEDARDAAASGTTAARRDAERATAAAAAAEASVRSDTLGHETLTLVT